MKKKIVLSVILVFSVLFVNDIYAQSAQQIAFVNSNEILDAIPEKVAAANLINDLNKKYKEELQVMQNDYNKKYSDFISYQNSMADNVRLRRMQELYELERQINSFMKVAQDDIQNQERNLIAPLRQKVKDAIYLVGVEQGYICIYDMANPTIAFITPDAHDANPQVKQKLGVQ